jgi:PAS domain S-box-containing protein
LTGFSRCEAIGKNLVDEFITEEYKISVKEVMHQALIGSETANFEFALFNKDGEKKVLLLSATARRGPDGKVIGVIGVGQDVTQMREISSERERVADDLSRLIETANAPIFGINMQGHVTEWNRKAADMLGYTQEETIGRDFVSNFIQPQNRSSVKEVLNRAMMGEEAANYELPLLSKSQRKLLVLLNATTRRDAKGRIIGVVGVGQDITEINQLMDESRRVADDLTRLIETANAPIFGINKRGQVTVWNRMVANITECGRDEALGKDLVHTFIDKHYKDSVRRVLDLALEGQETANFEFPLFTKRKDRKVQILMSVTPRRGPDGEVIGTIGVGQDITSLQAAKETADRTANELSRVIDSANAPICGVDNNLCVTEWNQTMSRISGVLHSEVLGTKITDWLFDAAERTNVESVLRTALDGKETANFELSLRAVIRRAGSAAMWCSCSVPPRGLRALAKSSASSASARTSRSTSRWRIGRCDSWLWSRKSFAHPSTASAASAMHWLPLRKMRSARKR